MMAIGPQPWFYNAPGLFSRQHVKDSADNNVSTLAQDFGYRAWMCNGFEHDRYRRIDVHGAISMI